jgi:hypothetical protein
LRYSKRTQTQGKLRRQDSIIKRSDPPLQTQSQRKHHTGKKNTFFFYQSCGLGSGMFRIPGDLSLQDTLLTASLYPINTDPNSVSSPRLTNSVITKISGTMDIYTPP